jgi:hypothetical protein
MSKGTTEFPPGIPDPDNTEINPMTVVSVGPFSLLAPGDTAQVVFAFLAGQDRADLEQNAFWAQRLYNDRYDVTTTAVEVADLTAVVTEGRVLLRWRLSAEAQRELLGVRVQRASVASGPFEERTHRALEPATAMSFEDFDVERGLDYWYRLILLSKVGSPRTAGPVSVRLISGLPTRTALHQPFEPADGGPIQIRYSISLPSTPVRLTVHDVRGRLVWSTSSVTREPGEHGLAWGRHGNAGARTPRGIYFVQLRAGRVAASRKLVLLHQ